jgi:hypothetical protein
LTPELQGVIYAVDGGTARPIPGFESGVDGIRKWSSDGRSLFVTRVDGGSLEIARLDLESGRREVWRTLTPPERVGLAPPFGYFAITPDGRYYAHSLVYHLSDLYLVTALE